MDELEFFVCDSCPTIRLSFMRLSNRFPMKIIQFLITDQFFT